MLYREFCDTCGSYILEYGVRSFLIPFFFLVKCRLYLHSPLKEPAKPHFRYICVGSLDDAEALPPKGEFFCKSRASWMPQVPGMEPSSFGVARL